MFVWPTIPERVPTKQWRKIKPRQLDAELVKFIERWPLRTTEEIASGLGVPVDRLRFRMPHLVNTGKVKRHGIGRVRMYALEVRHAGA